MDAAEITRDILYLSRRTAYPMSIDHIEVRRLEQAGVDVPMLIKTKRFYRRGTRPPHWTVPLKVLKD